ncbi:hypothetical protein YPC_2071 [Yersinia pestis biovar Medievalis str. Harbin 35]|nr:hypothetical protein YPC_2071 [Yersinia pestis biovar Medievalis str. Harbin 35]EEO76794.1 hypothetical protein YP516_2101 [Yersinia pestis Nepal516]EEO80141.1 hypothetical protein YPF_2957 [Yersinia pestis biovar Orientalis str. India 195]EEO89907.1 hypothetical protein YPS_2908 [Yersinia pestis Pestoides A]
MRVTTADKELECLLLPFLMAVSVIMTMLFLSLMLLLISALA